MTMHSVEFDLKTPEIGCVLEMDINTTFTSTEAKEFARREIKEAYPDAEDIEIRLIREID